MVLWFIKCSDNGVTLFNLESISVEEFLFGFDLSKPSLVVATVVSSTFCSVALVCASANVKIFEFKSVLGCSFAP